MGIRLHKLIGYGFDDLEENDPRIDWERLEEARESTAEEFDTYLRLVRDNDDFDVNLYLHARDKYKWSMSDVITYDSEFGLERVIVFGHPTQKNWSRYGDTLDTYQSYADGSNMEGPRCSRIGQSIYPYVSPTRIHLPTGETVSDSDIRMLTYHADKIKLSGGTEIEYHEKLDNDFVCEQASLSLYVAKFAGVKEEYLNRLVPLMYDYWS